ncbi:hypothetical protein GALMADRAFT_1211316 [Galerina marginata CBS 339.88]|uniref:Uncharacterized protein n=1 Tax=Galerina marginata (strain CBS 339.88) TaxID=685588 RepID=A0A067S7Z3_GALM3|nr:hypothetical protein GALMADRAFT_1211316 [Galerina marginata CBS 339.88]
MSIAVFCTPMCCELPFPEATTKYCFFLFGPTVRDDLRLGRCWCLACPRTSPRQQNNSHFTLTPRDRPSPSCLPDFPTTQSRCRRRHTQSSSLSLCQCCFGAGYRVVH